MSDEALKKEHERWALERFLELLKEAAPESVEATEEPDFVLTFGSRSGDFATENGLIINPSLSLNPVFGTADLTLVTATPSPGVLQFSAGTYSANVTGGSAVNAFKEGVEAFNAKRPPKFVGR